MPAKKLTKTVCDAAQHAGASNQTLYRDTELKGFGLRVTAGGAKAFFVEYRDGSRRRRMTVGNFGQLTVDEGRKLAKKHLYGAATGVDPMEQRRRAREGEAFDDVASRYFEDLKARAEAGARRGRLSSLTFAKGVWRRHVPPAMKKRRIQDVTVDDVRRMHRKLSDTPTTADHLRMVLHAVLEHAATEGLIDTNPASRVKKFNAPPKNPRRALTTEELGRLGEVLRKVEAGESIKIGDKSKTIHPNVALAIRTFALTGMRRSELLGHMTLAYRGPREGLRWGDVDLEVGSYKLEAHGGGSGGKGGQPRTLPLGATAVELLSKVKPEGVDGAPVVRSPLNPTAPLVGIDKPRRWIYQAAGIDGCDLHSLRHTFESIAFQEGPAFAGALTGRAAVKDPVLNSYIHVDNAQLREIADRVTARIAQALDCREAKVLEFRGER